MLRLSSKQNRYTQKRQAAKKEKHRGRIMIYSAMIKISPGGYAHWSNYLVFRAASHNHKSLNALEV